GSPVSGLVDHRVVVVEVDVPLGAVAFADLDLVGLAPVVAGLDLDGLAASDGLLRRLLGGRALLGAHRTVVTVAVLVAVVLTALTIVVVLVAVLRVLAEHLEILIERDVGLGAVVGAHLDLVGLLAIVAGLDVDHGAVDGLRRCVADPLALAARGVVVARGGGPDGATDGEGGRCGDRGQDDALGAKLLGVHGLTSVGSAVDTDQPAPAPLKPT